MTLSSELISQFVKATKDEKSTKTEATVYGTVVYDGRTYVKLDGSDQLTPVETTADTVNGERVTVMIKNHTATITGNITSPAARTDAVKALGVEVTQYTEVVANKVSTDQLKAEQARIDDLESNNVTINETLTALNAEVRGLVADNVTINQTLSAAEADIDQLRTNKLDVTVANATYATIEELEATNVDVYNLEATYGEFHTLATNKFSAMEGDIAKLQTDKLNANTAEITYAKIADLDALEANVDLLEADVADIDTLIFGSASGSTIQASFANAVIAQLGNAQIKSAMIENVSADKITAGDIITNNVRVKSQNGLLLISDETIQISDNARVRVQIGKDAANDYSINVWDADGNLMFSKGGITDSAIKDAIIRNDMVSDTANIAAHKLDIDSLFEEINGSTNTIKSTQIYLDDQAQTLDIAFKELETEVTELGSTVSSQGTQLSVVQGQISSKVWKQDIDTATDSMSTQYSALEQEVDGISATVASHSTQISTKAESSTVTNVSNRVTTLETNLTGFQSTVSATYATKKDLTEVEIGGRNLLLNSAAVLLNRSDNGNNNVSVLEEDYVKISPVAGGNVYNNGGGITTAVTRKQGKEYTLSFEILSPTWIGFYWYPSEHYAKTGCIPASDSWQKFVFTYTQTGEDSTGTTLFGFNSLAEGETYCYKNLKLEVGNKATDWTPAPEDVQSGIDEAQAAADAAQATANQNAQDMAAIVTNFNADVANLQTQIDGSITTWFYEVAPTVFNEPAVNWTTTESMNNHLGDLYYDTITGYCYRWQVQNNTYSWQRITDTDVTKALADAQTAQDTADQKRRVFYVQPTPPYDAGDLWVQGSGGDILRCKTAKTSGQSFASSDWIAASKYTDDTTAITANTNALAAKSAAANAQSDIDNLEIGGRNLLSGTATPRTVSAGTSQYAYETYMVTVPPLIKGQIYTVSADVEVLSGTVTTISVKSYNSATSAECGSCTIPITNGRIVGNITPTNDSAVKVLFYAGTAGSTSGNSVKFSNVKFEKGNRATDWTPAPEDVDSELSGVKSRVTTAETNIAQNTTAIGLRATKTEVETTLKNYSTTSEMNAAIQVKANNITSSVSSTYATKSALSTTNSNVTKAQNAIDNLEIGGRNLFSGYDENEIQLNDYQNTGSFKQFINCLTFNPCETVGETYTISFWAKSPNGSTPLSIYNQNGQPRHFYFERKLLTSALGSDWEYFTYTLTNVDLGESYADTNCNRIEFYASAQMGVLVKKIKVEKGNRATDWTPAPEDMATSGDVTAVQSSIDVTDERVTTAESLIQQLSESIMTLVTDGNGESLMVQTENGWTFSTGQIQSMIDSTSENLSNLTDEMGDVNTTVGALQQAVDDLGVLNDYVKIGVYENEPCIELGESDSDFKLLITNTRIMFMEGSGVPAYLNNQSLFIKKAVIEEELQQGEFVWKARSNGNLGLIWKGVNG